MYRRLLGSVYNWILKRKTRALRQNIRKFEENSTTYLTKICVYLGRCYSFCSENTNCKQTLLLLICFNCISVTCYALRDPTQPQNYRTESSDNLQQFNVTSILFSPERRTAVINERVVQAGDEVLGAKISAIESDHVILVVDGKSRSIPLMIQSIKKLRPKNEVVKDLLE